MLIDFRVYCTIYAVAYAANLGSWAISRERARAPVFWGTVAVILVTGLTNFLDFLWS